MARGANWIFVLVQALGAQHKQVMAGQRAGAAPWGQAEPRPVNRDYGLFASVPDARRPVQGGWLGQTDDPLRQHQRGRDWGNQAVPMDWRDTRGVNGCLCGHRDCPNA